MAHLQETERKDRLVARVRRIAGQVTAIERAITGEAALKDLETRLLAALPGRLGALNDALKSRRRLGVAHLGDDPAGEFGFDELGQVLA